ncbi:MAG: hypothetical protein ACTSUE_27635 [Promethearchaeota archaeon]
MKPVAKPAVKDISLNLMNAPREILLGNKTYELKFTLMNLKANTRDLSLNFESEGMKITPGTMDMKLAGKGKEEFIVSATPITDGKLDLKLVVSEKKTITYTETVLERPDGTIVSTEPESKPTVQTAVPTSPTATTAAVAAAAVKPSTRPIKTSKPAANVQVNLTQMEDEINSIREQYMDARTKLQSMTRGTSEYTEIYSKAMEFKKKYEELKIKYEKSAKIAAEASTSIKPVKPAGMKVQKPIATHEIKPASKPVKPAVKPVIKPPVKPVPNPDDLLIAEVTKIMDEYNSLRSKLTSMDPKDPDYMATREKAVELSKLYNEKRAEAQKRGLVS